MITIRKFQPNLAEYRAIVDLYNTLWPDGRHHPVDFWRKNDEEWPATALFQRFVVEQKSEILGIGSCYEKYWQHQAGTVHIDFHLRTGLQLEQPLFDHLLNYLHGLRPLPQILATRTREDRPERITFLRQHGFQLALRAPRSSLDIPSVDLSPFIDLESQLSAKEIQIGTLASIKKRSADWKQRLLTLRWAIIQDVPALEPPTRPTLADFETMILDDPALDENAWFIAVDSSKSAAGEWVGMCNLWLNDPTRKRLDTGLTGVIRGYRRKGIATGLKVRTILFAQRIGAATIAASNEENNPMYHLNLKLGFQPQAAWLSYRRPFI